MITLPLPLSDRNVLVFGFLDPSGGLYDVMRGREAIYF